MLPASLWSQAHFLPGLWTHLGAFESGFMQEVCTELNGNTCKLGPRPISTHPTPTHPSSGLSQAGAGKQSLVLKARSVKAVLQGDLTSHSGECTHSYPTPLLAQNILPHSNSPED